MSQADDDGENAKPDKEVRDNVSPVLKPKNVRNKNIAPPGMMGTAPPMFGGTSQLAPQQGNRETDRPKNSKINAIKPDFPFEKNRPIAMKTGDQEVNAYYSKTHRLVNEEDLRRQTQPPNPGLDGQRPVAVRTGDPEVDDHYAKTHRLIDKENLKQLKKQAIKEQLQNNRAQGPKRER